MMNHRESWAEERKAPSQEEWVQMQQEELEPKPRTRRQSTGDDKPRTEETQKPVTAAKVILRRKAD